MLQPNANDLRNYAKEMIRLANELESKNLLIGEIQARMTEGNQKISYQNKCIAEKDAYIASLEAELQHITGKHPELKLTEEDRKWLFSDFNRSLVAQNSITSNH